MTKCNRSEGERVAFRPSVRSLTSAANTDHHIWLEETALDEYSFSTQAKIKADLWLNPVDSQGTQLSLFSSEGSPVRKALTAVGLSLSINLAILGLFAAAFGNLATTRQGEVTVSEVESAPVIVARN
jgi:hypothetical protein